MAGVMNLRLISLLVCLVCLPVSLFHAIKKTGKAKRILKYAGIAFVVFVITPFLFRSSPSSPPRYVTASETASTRISIPDGPSLLQKVRDAMDSGDLQRARTAAEMALARDGLDTDIRVEIQALLQEIDVLEAPRLLAQSAEAFECGAAAFKAGQHVDAFYALRKVIAEDPHYEAAREMLSRAVPSAVAMLCDDDMFFPANAIATYARSTELLPREEVERLYALIEQRKEAAATAKAVKKPDLELLEAKSEGEGNRRYVVGTVKNNTNQQYAYVRIEFNLYDNSGAQVGNTSDTIANFESGGIWKFKARILEDSATNFKVKNITGR